MAEAARRERAPLHTEDTASTPSASSRSSERDIDCSYGNPMFGFPFAIANYNFCGGVAVPSAFPSAAADVQQAKGPFCPTPAYPTPYLHDMWMRSILGHLQMSAQNQSAVLAGPSPLKSGSAKQDARLGSKSPSPALATATAATATATAATATATTAATAVPATLTPSTDKVRSTYAQPAPIAFQTALPVPLPFQVPLSLSVPLPVTGVLATSEPRERDHDNSNDSDDREHEHDNSTRMSSPATARDEGTKLFHCPVDGCDKAFRLRASQERHVLTHTGEKPFVCRAADCRRAFNDKANLRRHEKAHSGDKPFICARADCQRKFTRRSALRLHIQRVHKVTATDDGSSES